MGRPGICVAQFHPQLNSTPAGTLQHLAKLVNLRRAGHDQTRAQLAMDRRQELDGAHRIIASSSARSTTSLMCLAKAISVSMRDCR
jgi:hypothetical protein